MLSWQGCLTVPIFEVVYDLGLCRAWSILGSTAAAVAATVAFTSTSHCNKFTDNVQNARKRHFFKYEKRLRQKSTHEKMFEYFASQTSDGKHCMTAHDILRALIAVYPPDDATWTRNGSLDGERAPHITSVRFLQPLLSNLNSRSKASTRTKVCVLGFVYICGSMHH